MDTTGVPLREAVNQALDAAIQLLREPGLRGARLALAPALESLTESRRLWDNRMRVALAGRPSAGKSTLINALLGERLAETDVKEMTKVVTWLAHGKEPNLSVHDKDGRAWPVEPPTLRKLAEATTHKYPGGGFSDIASFVRYEYPNDWLEAFDIIDTPGTDSVLGTDSDSTVRHLGPREDTADALIIVFPKAGARTDDVWLAEHFQQTAAGGAGAVNTVTTVGALTFIETEYWDKKPGLIEDGELKAIKVARKMAEDNLMREAGLRRILYDLRPVASKVAEAAGALGEPEFADLAGLVTGGPAAVRMSPGELAQLAANKQRWNRLAPLAPSRRAPLISMFTGYGVVLACELIRDGVASPAELRRRLCELSGLTAFRDLIAEHFGDRADLIRLVRLIARTRALVSDQRGLLTFRQHDILEQAAQHILRLEIHRGEFDQQRVLRDYRDGLLQLSRAETDEMLRVFGELPGVKLAADRLGLPGARPAELAARAARRSEHWWRRADQGPYGGETRAACLVISRSYDYLGAAVAR